MGEKVQQVLRESAQRRADHVITALQPRKTVEQRLDEIQELLVTLARGQRLILDLLGPDEEDEEESDQPAKTLDGEPAGGERDPSQSLG